MPTQEQRHKDLTRRFHEEVWENRNLEYIDEQIAADFIGHDPGLPGPVRGPEGVRETAEMFQSGFPDAEVEIERMVAEDNLLAVHRRLSGTHEGEFMGIEPTGTEVEVPGIAIYSFEDSNVVKEWQVVDNLGLLVQLGVVEPPTEPAATETTDLQQRLDDVGSVLVSGDAERIGALYTQESQLFPPERDVVTGREAAAEFWQGVGDMGVETIDIEPMEVDIQNGTARRVGRATLAGADGATIDQVTFIEIWKRDDGAWRIHRDIWNSSIPDED